MAGFASQRPCRKTESPLGRTHWAGRTGQDSLGRTHWAGLTHTILADRLASVPMLECTPHTGQFDEASPTEGHGGHNWNNWHNRQNERNGLRTYVRMGTAGTAAIVSFHVRTYVRTHAYWDTHTFGNITASSWIVSGATPTEHVGEGRVQAHDLADRLWGKGSHGGCDDTTEFSSPQPHLPHPSSL